MPYNRRSAPLYHSMESVLVDTRIKKNEDQFEELKIKDVTLNLILIIMGLFIFD